MKEAFSEFFIHIFDIPFAVQILCASVSTVLLLGVRGNRTKIWRIIVDVVWLFAVFFVLQLFFNVVGHFMPRKYAFTADFGYFVGIVIYTVAASRHKWINRLAMACVVFSVNTLMASLGTVFGNAIEMRIDGFDILITKIIAYLAVVACSVVFFKYPLFKFETNLFDCILNVVCNVLSAALIIIYEYVRRSSHEMTMIGFEISGFMTVVIIFLFAINIVTYFMTYHLCYRRERALDLSLQRQKEQSLKELLTLNESKLAELREVRHDVKNQYAYMQMLLENEKFAELKDYFAEVLGTLAKPLFKSVDSGNALIDSVLNLELTKASDAGVALDLRVSVPPDLPFSKSTLLSLFANVIDNAVEAVVRDGTENATVEVTLCMQGDYLLFCVANPTRLADTEKIDELATSKSDKTVHGLGSKIIKKTVKKCNGYYRRFVKDGKFVSECLLDTLYKEKSGGGTH